MAGDERFQGSRDGLGIWMERWQGRVTDVALEASIGWRWITQELEAHGFRVHLADPAEARAKRGRTKKAKTDKLDARWPVLLLCKQDLPEAWISTHLSGPRERFVSDRHPRYHKIDQCDRTGRIEGVRRGGGI